MSLVLTPVLAFVLRCAASRCALYPALRVVLHVSRSMEFYAVRRDATSAQRSVIALSGSCEKSIIS